MGQETWSAVDAYVGEKLLPLDPVLTQALRANAEAGLPKIDVSPPQGKFLELLATLHGARRILEVGTLGGYSTICLARALPADGVLISLEAMPRHAEVARANLARASLRCHVEVRVGLALDSLATLEREQLPPFDLVFIDADKENNAGYLTWALRLTRPGAVIVVDNVIRHGEIADAASTEPRVVGTRKLFDLLTDNPRLSATALQTVGSKGYDGFLLARVL